MRRGYGRRGRTRRAAIRGLGSPQASPARNSQFGSTGSRSEGINGVGKAQVTDRKGAAHGGEPNGRLSSRMPRTKIPRSVQKNRAPTQTPAEKTRGKVAGEGEERNGIPRRNAENQRPKISPNSTKILVQ